MTVIDVASDTAIGTIPVGKWPKAVAFAGNGSKAYVTNYGSNSVSVVSPTPAPTPVAKPGKVRDCRVRVKGRAYAFAWRGPRITGGAAVTYQTRISEPNSTKYHRWRNRGTNRSIAGTVDRLGANYRIQARAVNSAGPGPACATRFRPPRPKSRG